MSNKRKTRAERTADKYQEIRKLFTERYTNQKRVNGARIYTSAYIISCLAEEFWLSMRQIENIVYSKPKTVQMPAASTEAAAAELLPLKAAA
jgi:hypothetical protein